MVSDVKLTPQGTPRATVGREVPTLSYEDLGVPSLKSVGAPRLSGLDAQSRALSISSQNARNFSNDLSNITNVILDQERKRRKEEEADRNSILEAQLDAASETLATGAMAELDLYTSASIDNAVMASNGVPSITMEMLNASLEGTTSSTPDPNMRLSVADLTKVKVAPIVEEQQTRLAEAELVEAQNNIEASQTLSERDAMKYAAPTTTSQEIAGATSLMKVDQLIDARTDLRPGEKMTLKLETRRKIVSSAALQMIGRSQAPAATALTILQGASGIEEFDNLPSDEKFNIFNKAMTIQNYYTSQENRYKEAQAQQRDFDRTRLLIDSAREPGNPQSVNNLEYLLETSEDPSEVRLIQSQMDRLQDKVDEPYARSNLKVKANLQQQVMLGLLSEQQTAQITRELLGRGISIDDQLELVDLAAENANFGQYAKEYEVVVDKAKDIFPKAFSSKKDPMAFALSLAAGKDIPDATPEEERQEKLFRAFTIELREKVLRGESGITNSGQFLDEADKLLQKYQGQMNGSTPPKIPGSIKDYELDTLNQTERNTWQTLIKDEALVKKVDERYINNYGLIDQDVFDKRITVEEASKIQSLITPKARMEQNNGR